MRGQPQAPNFSSLLTPRSSAMGTYWLASGGIHLFFVLLAMGISAWVAGPRINLDPKPITASLIRLGKPREEKLLPRKEEERPETPVEKSAPPTPVPAAVVSKPVSIPSLHPKEEKPTKTAPVSDKASKASLFDAFHKVGKTAKPEELEGAADGDLNGTSNTQEGERYFGLLHSAIDRYYDVSNSIPEAERAALTADLLIKIGADGSLLLVKLEKPSNNALFNEAVVAAVQKAAPFSPPPPHLKDMLKRTGQLFRFKP